MSAERRIPNFHIRMIGPPNYFRISLFAFLFFLPLSASIILGKPETLWDWLGFCLFLLVDLILFVVIVYSIRLIVPLLGQKKAWLKASTSAQTTIADRKMNIHEEEYGYWVDGWSLGLAMIPPQLVVEPEESVVWVSVSKALYNKYANKSSVRIHYSTKNPFEFLLENEV
jgi:hypothetical protein